MAMCKRPSHNPQQEPHAQAERAKQSSVLYAGGFGEPCPSKQEWFCRGSPTVAARSWHGYQQNSSTLGQDMSLIVPHELWTLELSKLYLLRRASPLASPSVGLAPDLTSSLFPDSSGKTDPVQFKGVKKRGLSASKIGHFSSNFSPLKHRICLKIASKGQVCLLEVPVRTSSIWIRSVLSLLSSAP